MTDLPDEAREMLARAYEDDGLRLIAHALRTDNVQICYPHRHALRAIVDALKARADEVERLREAAQQAVVALDHKLNTLLDSVCLRDRNGAARRETAEEGALPDVERMEAALASLRAALNRTGGE